jgi:hypothetical protein
MTKSFVLFSFILWTKTYLGQSPIYFDTTLYDCGQIIEGTQLKRDWYFTNRSAEDILVIASGSGGGLIPQGPRYPIAPGQRGAITFIYDTKKIGTFQKGILVSYYGKSESGRFSLSVIGDVVRKRTTIEVNHTEADLGNIDFGQKDSATFEIINSGSENLYFSNPQHISVYAEADLFSLHIEKKSIPGQTAQLKQEFYSPKDTLQVKILLQNRYGNTGAFKRTFNFIYNSHDTLTLSIKGNYGGAINFVEKGTFTDGYCDFEYENDKLVKRTEVNPSDSKIVREDFYEDSYCFHSKRYDYFRHQLKDEYFYEKGKLIDSKMRANKYLFGEK